MFVQILDRDDENEVAANLIKERVRKTVQPTATGSLGHLCPSSRVLENAAERSFDFRCEFQAQSFTLKVVVRYGFSKFVVSGFEKVCRHGEYFCSISSKTLAAGIAARSPRS